MKCACCAGANRPAHDFYSTWSEWTWKGSVGRRRGGGEGLVRQSQPWVTVAVAGCLGLHLQQVAVIDGLFNQTVVEGVAQTKPET
jgi:hypothetical protein